MTLGRACGAAAAAWCQMVRRREWRSGCWQSSVSRNFENGWREARPDGELGGVTALKQYKRATPCLPVCRGDFRRTGHAANAVWRARSVEDVIAVLLTRHTDCIASTLVSCVQFWIAL